MVDQGAETAAAVDDQHLARGVSGGGRGEEDGLAEIVRTQARPGAMLAWEPVKWITLPPPWGTHFASARIRQNSPSLLLLEAILVISTESSHSSVSPVSTGTSMSRA